MDKSLTRKIITEGTVMVSNKIKIHSDHLRCIPYTGASIKSVEDFSKLFRSYRQSYSKHTWDSCTKEIAIKLYGELEHSQVDHPFKTILSGYYNLMAYNNNIYARYEMDDNNDMTLIMRVVLVYNEELNRIEVKPIKNK